MDGNFLAFYYTGDKITAVAGQSRPLEILTYMEAMNQNLMPPAEDIKSGKETADSVRAKLKSNKGAGRCKREHCCKKKPVAV